jgi:hypothetical protein
MDQIVLAGAAETHPTASLIVGFVVLALAIVVVWWLLGKIFK